MQDLAFKVMDSWREGGIRKSEIPQCAGIGSVGKGGSQDCVSPLLPRLIAGSRTSIVSPSPIGCCEPRYRFSKWFDKKMRIYLPYESSPLKQLLTEIKFTVDNNKKCLMHDPEHPRQEVDWWCMSFYPYILSECDLCISHVYKPNFNSITIFHKKVFVASSLVNKVIIFVI